MSSERWGLTGDTIKFGTDGRLLDGQNRLAACIKSGKNFKTHVIFGIDPGLFGRMDIGKPINPADILHIAGYKYVSTLDVAIKWARLLDNDPYGRSTLQPDEVLRLAKEKYNDIEPYLKYGRAINRQFAHPSGQLAALIYHFSRSDNKRQWILSGLGLSVIGAESIRSLIQCRLYYICKKLIITVVFMNLTELVSS